MRKGRICSMRCVLQRRAVRHVSCIDISSQFYQLDNSIEEATSSCQVEWCVFSIVATMDRTTSLERATLQIQDRSANKYSDKWLKNVCLAKSSCIVERCASILCLSRDSCTMLDQLLHNVFPACPRCNV